MLRLLYPWEKALGTHWIGGRVGSKSRMDNVEKRKFLPLLELELDLLVTQLPSHYTYCTIPETLL
jgi:hypothetical protein